MNQLPALEMGARAPARATGLKDATAGALLLVLAAAPIPGGSNRPIFWTGLAGVVAVIAIVYFGAALWRGVPIRMRWAQAGIPLLLLGLLLAYLAAQLAPLGEAAAQAGLAGPIAGPTVSLAPGATLLMGLQFATYGLFGLLVVQVTTDRRRAVWVMHGIFFIVTLHAAYALLALTQLGDTLLILEKWAYRGAATGTFVNANSFATFLAFGLALGTSLILRLVSVDRPGRDGFGQLAGNVDWPGVTILLACMLINGAALAATESRLGAVAAAAGIAVALLVAQSRRRRRRGPGIGVAIAVVMAIGISALALFGGGLLERLGSLQESADVRGALYEQVVGMIAERPWTGYGGGSFEIVFPFFHRLPVSPDLVWDKAHSTYLGLWADLGLVFGTLPMVIFAFAAARLLLVSRTRPRDWALPLGGLAVIVVGAVHSIADFSLEIEANALMVVAIVAVAMSTQTSAEFRRTFKSGPRYVHAR